MNAEKLKKELESHLPDVEKFLTSVIQEESGIKVASADLVSRENISKEAQKEDIFVYGREQQLGSDVILVLDKEWFGLLSSIMLGVVEKTNNEITRDLLTKFAKELVTMLQKKFKLAGQEFKFGDVEVLTLRQVEKKFGHGNYYHAKMEVSGLADEDVRAELLVGELQAVAEKTEEKNAADGTASTAGGATASSGDRAASAADETASPDQSAAEKEGQFAGMDTDKLEEVGKKGSMVDDSDVVSGRKVEFDEFQNGNTGANGHSHSMALLKDIEMEVSVQLGQIEMPLGKVLQLSKGSIIELDKLAGEPVDIMVNGSKVAHGEVVVIDEHFGVRISNLITTRERLASLK